MKKLKIGFFMDDYYPSLNGVIEVMDNYAKRLVKMGHEVVVVVPNIDKNYIDDFSYKVIRLPSVKVRPIGYSAAVVKYNKFIEKKLLDEKFDLIHVHSPFFVGNLGVKIAKKLKIPVVGTMHTQFDKDIKKLVRFNFLSKKVLRGISKTYNRCDRCFSVNKKTADVYQKYGVKKKPVVLITGTDMEIVKNEEQSIFDVNQKYNLKKEDLVFLFVGRLTVVKNIPFLLESLSYLKQKNIKFKMLFVGPFEDEKEINACIKKFDLKSEVIFTGKIIDRELLKKIYFRSKLFLFPSLYDTNSLVQKEAASQKRPTVFIKDAVTAEFVVDNKNGFLSENNPVSYAKKIEEILKNDELYNKVSEDAYKTLYVHWDFLINELKKNYIDVLDKKRKKSLN